MEPPRAPCYPGLVTEDGRSQLARSGARTSSPRDEGIPRRGNLRYALLAAGAAGVVLMGVHLFVEVRAAPPPAPAVAQAAPAEHAASRQAPLPAARPVRPVTHAPAPAPAPAPAAPSPAPPPTLQPSMPAAGRVPAADPKLMAVMDQANEAYNNQDYDQAMDIALKVLAQHPGTVRMLRIMVSSSCIAGDQAVGQKYFDQLPRYDRDQMNTRCSRYGVTFKEPAQ